VKVREVLLKFQEFYIVWRGITQLLCLVSKNSFVNLRADIYYITE